MYDNLPPLDWLRAFEAAARRGTFTAAAEELSLTPAAVSHQIRSLEAHLDRRLFDRHNTRLALNRAGHDYRPVVSSALSALDHGTGALFGDRSRAGVTVRCLSSLAHVWLIPRLPEFLAEHPEIGLTLLSTSWSETREGRGIDLDIRYGTGDWSDGVVLPLLGGEVVAVCRPDLAVPDETTLTRAPRIEMSGVTDTWRTFFDGIELDPPVVTVDQSAAALALVHAGVGHALLAKDFVDHGLATGQLVTSTPRSLISGKGHYLVRATKTASARDDVDTVVEWLQKMSSGME